MTDEILIILRKILFVVGVFVLVCLIFSVLFFLGFMYGYYIYFVSPRI